MFPTPQVTTSASLAHLAALRHFRRKALTNLWDVFLFRSLCDEIEIPKNSGKTIQMHRFGQFTPVTTNATEGEAPGFGKTLSTAIVTATLGTFSDYMTFGRLLLDTDYADAMSNSSKILGAQAGGTVDLLVKSTMDTSQATTNQNPLAADGFLTLKDFRAASTNLQAAKVRVQAGGWFESITHPYNEYDVKNDPNAGGLLDLHKYTDPSKADTNHVMHDGGQAFAIDKVRVRTSANVTKIVGSPNKWRTYIAGKEAIALFSLAGNAPSQMSDPDAQNFELNIKRTSGVDYNDPTGEYGGLMSYRFVTACGYEDVARAITIDAACSIQA